MRNRRHAFTLVEVLLSIALLAGLFAAGVALLFQFSSSLTAQTEDPVFDRHADGVDRFLRAYRADGRNVPKGDLKTESGLLPSIGVAPSICAPLLQHRSSPIPGENSVLSFKSGSGLWLVWRSSGPSHSATPTIERVLLSPWVVSAEVFGFDEKSNRWDLAKLDSTAHSELRVLRLELAHSGHSRTLWIPWGFSLRQDGGGR